MVRICRVTHGVQPDALRQPRGMGGGSGGRGHRYNLWLIHVDVWQKPTQYCKAIILQKNLAYSMYNLQIGKF